MFCSEMNACDGWVGVAPYLLNSLMQGLRTREVPVARSVQERERVREREQEEVKL